MKLISVQSNGDRLVKVWQRHCYVTKKLWNEIHTVKFTDKGIIRRGIRGNHRTSRALKAAAEWLEGAQT